MKNLVCALLGHKWKKQVLTIQGKVSNSYTVVEKCERCGIFNIKDWTSK